MPVSPVDLTVILGNALENAINACALTEKEPWIKVTVGVVGGSLAIQVENSCTGVVYAAKGYEDGSFYPADESAAAGRKQLTVFTRCQVYAACTG
ncbi:MAG TPA: ATP-binding protein [Candidatus Mediterraneibacter excrementavium]|nr:ATP-binding protein [Candidatus Mediterraneibacter excrementavium]